MLRQASNPIMNIGIDARMLGPGFGLARYVQQLVLALAHIDSPHRFVLFLRKDNWDAFVPKKDTITKVLADIPWYTIEEQVRLPGLIKKEHIDLMHFPHWNVPYFYSEPFVLTLHDLTMFHYPRPEATTRSKVVFWAKDKAHRVVIRRAAKKAEHIITASEFTKRDVHKTLRVPLDKMTTIYQAPFEGDARRKTQDAKDFLKTHNITKPYVLYVGASYPHKNLDGLVAAWELFERKYGEDYQLVLAGKRNYFYERLQSRIKNQQTIIFTGFLPDNELSALYDHAELFVFPSLYEGFGLPPLEAMAHGVPVVSSSSSCLPEVLGEAALYMDPGSPEDMAEKIHLGLTDNDIRFELKRLARENLSRFSWERLAHTTQEIYEQCT
jgi:glycosyltransferase involved in cell wall biosynthesis